MPETRISVSATVKAPPAVVFDALASPYRHHEFDATGMVGDDEYDEPITRVGQVFRMNMHYTDTAGKTTDYQVDNRVTKFKANRKIAWAPGAVDAEPFGWFWRYDLSPKGKEDQKTLVTVTYDWADVSDADRERYGVPLVDAAGLERSLEMLGKVLKR